MAQDRHYLELNAQKPGNPLQSGRIIEVFDARADRTGIGWVRTGLDNARTPADLKSGLVPALQQWLLSPTEGAAAAPLALRVHQFSIDERLTPTAEISTVEVVADLLRPRPDGQYELLWRAAEAVESRGLDVTGKHPANLATAWRACLQQFEAAGPATLSAVAVLTAEQARTPLAKLEPLVPFPVQTEKVRRPGVYHSFEEFRHNEPSGKKLVALSKTPRTGADWQGTDEVDVFYVNEQGARSPVRNVWGYCDGQELYILHHRRYYPLTPVGNGYMFEAPSVLDPDLDAMVAGAALGGVVGMGIAAAATGDAGRRQEHQLSLLTGRVTALPLQDNRDAFADEGKEGQVVVYRRKPSTDVVDVYAGTRVVGGLTPDNASVTMAWSDRRNGLKLCLRPIGSTAEVCVEALPRPGETLYYEWVEGPDMPALKMVPVKEGAFEVRKAALRTRQAQKQK
ncbi:hypothetical protein GCM10027048_28530 [Hymenobacter coalescens]